VQNGLRQSQPQDYRADNSPNRLCIVDSGAGTSTGPVPLMKNGRRPDTIEYCTDVVWLGKDEGVRVQAAQDQAVRAAIRAKRGS
jgi:hypothetical protein